MSPRRTRRQVAAAKPDGVPRIPACHIPPDTGGSPRPYAGNSQIPGPSSRADARPIDVDGRPRTPTRHIPSDTGGFPGVEASPRRANVQPTFVDGDPRTPACPIPPETGGSPGDEAAFGSGSSTSDEASPVARRQPELTGTVLTVWFPMPGTVVCPHLDCQAKFSAASWTAVKQSVTRHLRDLHVDPTTVKVQCVGCERVLGTRPGSHKCSVAIRPAETCIVGFACTVAGCIAKFPTKQGLGNHIRNHNRQAAIDAAAVTLPAPATRQNERANNAPRVARGGDARVPPAVVASPVPVTPVVRAVTPRRETPRNDGHFVVVASPALWRPPLDNAPSEGDGGVEGSTSSAADVSAVSSRAPSESDGGAGDESADTLPDVPVDDLLQPDDTTPLHAFRELARQLARDPCTEENWGKFVDLVDQMTAEAAVIVKLPVRTEGGGVE